MAVPREGGRVRYRHPTRPGNVEALQIGHASEGVDVFWRVRSQGESRGLQKRLFVSLDAGPFVHDGRWRRRALRLHGRHARVDRFSGTVTRDGSTVRIFGSTPEAALWSEEAGPRETVDLSGRRQRRAECGRSPPSVLDFSLSTN